MKFLSLFGGGGGRARGGRNAGGARRTRNPRAGRDAARRRANALFTPTGRVRNPRR